VEAGVAPGLCEGSCARLKPAQIHTMNAVRRNSCFRKMTPGLNPLL
jgi:hypothetical protein